MQKYCCFFLTFCIFGVFWTKKETRKGLCRTFQSRSHPVDISWEHGAFFDVGDAEEAGGDALQADGEAAVRGVQLFATRPILVSWNFTIFGAPNSRPTFV